MCVSLSILDDRGNNEIQKSVGKILLDLARCSETQSDICDNSELMDMIVARAGDEGTVIECKVYALQTLEEIGKTKPQAILQRVRGLDVHCTCVALVKCVLIQVHVVHI